MPQLDIYLAGISDPKQRANVRKALSREMLLNGKAKATRAEHGIALYTDGYRVRVVRNKVRLVAPNGTFFEERDVTKALCDFVVFLTEYPKIEANYIAAMQRDTKLD